MDPILGSLFPQRPARKLDEPVQVESPWLQTWQDMYEWMLMPLGVVRVDYNAEQQPIRLVMAQWKARSTVSV